MYPNHGSSITYGSLFSGIGGIDLALDRLGMDCLWQVELDDYCRKVLDNHWPNVEKLKDVRECGMRNLAPVDLICGGFPCTDVSVAGRRAGIEAPRSGLWKEFARIIRDLRPRYVFVENVEGLLHNGMGRVLGDLASLGYDAEWEVLSAADVGAPHLRKRVWIVAYTVLNPEGTAHGQGSDRGGADRVQEHRHGVGDDPRDCGEALAYARQQGLQGHAGDGHRGNQPGRLGEEPDGPTGEAGVSGGIWGEDWWQSESGIRRVAHGISNRVHRLKALGNAVVPQCAYVVAQRFLELEEESTRVPTHISGETRHKIGPRSQLFGWA